MVMCTIVEADDGCQTCGMLELTGGGFSPGHGIGDLGLRLILVWQ